MFFRISQSQSKTTIEYPCPLANMSGVLLYAGRHLQMYESGHCLVRANVQYHLHLDKVAWCMDSSAVTRHGTPWNQ